MVRQYHRSAFLPRRKQGISGILMVGAAIVIIGLAGCGTRIDTPLPDLSTRDERPVMSSAEQQKAVDALIAKRDSAAQTQASGQRAPSAGQEQSGTTPR